MQDRGFGLGQVTGNPNATAGERGDHAGRRGRTGTARHAEEVAVVRLIGRIWTTKIRITEVLSTRANIYRGRARRPLGQVGSEVRDGRVEEVAVAPRQRVVFERRRPAEPDLAQAHLGRRVARAGRDELGVLGKPPQAFPRGLVGHVQPEGPADERSGPGEVDEVMVGDALPEHKRQSNGRARPSAAGR